MSNRRLPLLALVVALMASLTVEAAEWAAEPSVSLRGEYDDNFRLTPARHDDVWGAIIDPRLKLSRRSDLWDLNASGRVRAANYTGEDGLNTVDNFFDLAAKRRMERGSVGISAGLINDTTLQNEVLDVDTGLTVNQIDRTRQNLGLTGQYMFTEATWVEVAANYSKNDYDEGERYGLLDYDYLTPSLRIIHQYNPQTQVFGILSHSKVTYDTPTELESTTDSLQLGSAYDITETWKVSASVGSRRTKTSSMQYELVATLPPGFENFPQLCGSTLPIFGPINCLFSLVPSDTESTGLVYDASLTREFETGSIKLTASQAVTPSSTGTDSESTQISLNGIHRFSTKLSTGLAVSYYQTSTVGDTTTRVDQKRYRIAPSLTWQLDEELALNTGYAYTRVKRESGNDNTVDSNAVFISLGYTWPRMAVSR